AVPEGGAVGTVDDRRPQGRGQGGPEERMDADTLNDQMAGGRQAAVPPPAPTAPALPVDESEDTMASLLDNPANAMRSLQRGEVIDGVVARIDPDEVLVDIGQKSEGVISGREMDDEVTGELHVGSKILVYVIQPEGPEGHAI